MLMGEGKCRMKNPGGALPVCHQSIGERWRVKAEKLHMPKELLINGHPLRPP